MQLDITGKHVDINERLRSNIKKKLARIERHYDHITTVRVTLSVDKIQYRAEATVHVNGNELFADTRAPDVLSAIDSLVDKLDRQVIKHKEKSTRHRERAAHR
jgi:putative sigma-54 modulation protein